MELTALALAWSLLLIIFSMLVKYNDLNIDDWNLKYVININTAVAILSTLLRAFIVAIAEKGWFYYAFFADLS